MYLHDEHARIFYEKIQKQNLTCEKIEELYNNSGAFPHLFGRWIRPVDIDATIHQSKMDGLITELEKTFKVHRIFSRDPKNYLPHMQIQNGDLTHVRYKIFPIKRDMNSRIIDALKSMHEATKSILKDHIVEFMNSINIAMYKMPTFTIDIMVNMRSITEPMYDPPFGNLDFECNALLLKKDGYSVSSQLISSMMSPSARHQKMMRIMQDILQKKAIMVHSNAGVYRAEKMKKKGYTILYNYTHINKCIDTYSGYCVICHDDLKEKHHKLNCCDARYHNSCLVDASRKGPVAMALTEKCLMCKRDILAIQTDIEAFITIEEDAVTIAPSTV